MISKNSKKVYTYIKGKEEKEASYAQIQHKFGYSIGEVGSVCQCLIDEGLAARNSVGGIRLTEKGRNRAKFCAVSVFKNIIWNIFVPIAVSIATTLITMWISGYWAK